MLAHFFHQIQAHKALYLKFTASFYIRYQLNSSFYDKNRLITNNVADFLGLLLMHLIFRWVAQKRSPIGNIAKNIYQLQFNK